MTKNYRDFDVDSLTDEELDTWISGTSPLSDSEAKGIDKVIEDAFLTVFGRPINRAILTESPALLESALSQAMVQHDLSKHVEEGVADSVILELWEQFIQSPESIGDEISIHMRVERALPAILDCVFDYRVLRVVRSLGPEVAAASFAGPEGSVLILSEEMLKRSNGSVDNLEAEFRIWHHYAHVLSGDLRVENYGCRLEYRNDTSHPFVTKIVMAEEYSRTEVSANETAVRFMYDEYSDPGAHFGDQGLLLSTYGPSLRASKLGEIARTLVGYPGLGSEASFSIVMWTIRRVIGNVLRPQPYFEVPIILARCDWWSPVYLLWSNGDGTHRRKWVPARAVVHGLGLRLGDVRILDSATIERYSYDGVLVDPNDVKSLRSIMQQYIRRSYLPFRLLKEPVLDGEGSDRPTSNKIIDAIQEIEEVLDSRGEKNHIAVSLAES